MKLPSLKRLLFVIKYGFIHLFVKNEGYDVIIEVENILTRAGKPLTQPEKDRLYSDAIIFKNSLLYRLMTETTPTEIQRMLVEEAKTEDQYNYFRAILADRRMVENWVNRCIDKNI